MPTSDSGKAIASRNATTHGLFSRDIVLPALGEDPEGYRQLEAEWMAQLPPRTLLERHYVEKIAAASWRLRRLHRWQAQLFEDNSLTEDERLERLDRAMRHETALHRQIDTAVKMLNKDAPQLFAQRAREQVQEDLRMFEGECRADLQDEMVVALEVQNRLCRIRKATEKAVSALSVAPLDTCPPQSSEKESSENCENELPGEGVSQPLDTDLDEDTGPDEICENEPSTAGLASAIVRRSPRGGHSFPAQDAFSAQEPFSAAGTGRPGAGPSRPPGINHDPRRIAV